MTQSLSQPVKKEGQHMQLVMDKIREIKDRMKEEERQKMLNVDTVEDARNMAEAMQNILR
jgi:CHASE3 domain sensor protein